MGFAMRAYVYARISNDPEEQRAGVLHPDVARNCPVDTHPILAQSTHI